MDVKSLYQTSFFKKRLVTFIEHYYKDFFHIHQTMFKLTITFNKESIKNNFQNIYYKVNERTEMKITHIYKLKEYRIIPSRDTNIEKFKKTYNVQIKEPKFFGLYSIWKTKATYIDVADAYKHITGVTLSDKIQ